MRNDWVDKTPTNPDNKPLDDLEYSTPPKVVKKRKKKVVEKFDDPASIARYLRTTDGRYQGTGGEMTYDTHRPSSASYSEDRGKPALCYAPPGQEIVTIDIPIRHPIDDKVEVINCKTGAPSRLGNGAASRQGVLTDYSIELLNYCDDKTLILELSEQWYDASKPYQYRGDWHLEKYNRSILVSIIMRTTGDNKQQLVSRPLGLRVRWWGRKAHIPGKQVSECSRINNGTAMVARVIQDIDKHGGSCG